MDSIQGLASGDALLSMQPPPPRDEKVPPSENETEETVEDDKGKVVDTSA